MAVLVEMHHTGDPALRRGVVAIVDHVLSDRPGEGALFLRLVLAYDLCLFL
jgi:hypothetical protein